MITYYSGATLSMSLILNLLQSYLKQSSSTSLLNLNSLDSRILHGAMKDVAYEVNVDTKGDLFP